MKEKIVVLKVEEDILYVLKVENGDEGVKKVLEDADAAWETMEGDDVPEFSDFILEKLEQAGYRACFSEGFEVFECIG